MGKNYRKQKSQQRARMQNAREKEVHSPRMALITKQCDSAASEYYHVREKNEANVLQTSIISPRMLELNVVAESAGYVMRDVPGNGDCMFSAISVAVEQLGLHYSQHQLRQMTADYLRRNPYVEGDSSNPRWNFIDAEILQLPTNSPLDRQLVWNLYLDRIGKPYSNGGIWGDEMALKACSDILEVQIHVYRFDGINYQPYGRQYQRRIALGYVMYEGHGNMIGRQNGEH